jgi:glucose-1-phosphate thymidylyltransferase
MPVSDEPMIYYPFSTLVPVGIRDTRIILTHRDLPLFQRLFGDGSQYGLSLRCTEQPAPQGLAQADTPGTISRRDGSDHSLARPV